MSALQSERIRQEHFEARISRLVESEVSSNLLQQQGAGNDNSQQQGNLVALHNSQNAAAEEALAAVEKRNTELALRLDRSEVALAQEKSARIAVELAKGEAERVHMKEKSEWHAASSDGAALTQALTRVKDLERELARRSAGDDAAAGTLTALITTPAVVLDVDGDDNGDGINSDERQERDDDEDSAQTTHQSSSSGPLTSSVAALLNAMKAADASRDEAEAAQRSAEARAAELEGRYVEEVAAVKADCLKKSEEDDARVAALEAELAIREGTIQALGLELRKTSSELIAAKAVAEETNRNQRGTEEEAEATAEEAEERRRKEASMTRQQQQQQSSKQRSQQIPASRDEVFEFWISGHDRIKTLEEQKTSDAETIAAHLSTTQQLRAERSKLVKAFAALTKAVETGKEETRAAEAKVSGLTAENAELLKFNSAVAEKGVTAEEVREAAQTLRYAAAQQALAMSRHQLVTTEEAAAKLKEAWAELTAVKKQLTTYIKMRNSIQSEVQARRSELTAISQNVALNRLSILIDETNSASAADAASASCSSASAPALNDGGKSSSPESASTEQQQPLKIPLAGLLDVLRSVEEGPLVKELMDTLRARHNTTTTGGTKENDTSAAAGDDDDGDAAAAAAANEEETSESTEDHPYPYLSALAQISCCVPSSPAAATTTDVDVEETADEALLRERDALQRFNKELSTAHSDAKREISALKRTKEVANEQMNRNSEVSQALASTVTSATTYAVAALKRARTAEADAFASNRRYLVHSAASLRQGHSVKERVAAVAAVASAKAKLRSLERQKVVRQRFLPTQNEGDDVDGDHNNDGNIDNTNSNGVSLASAGEAKLLSAMVRNYNDSQRELSGYKTREAKRTRDEVVLRSATKEANNWCTTFSQGLSAIRDDASRACLVALPQPQASSSSSSSISTNIRGGNNNKKAASTSVTKTAAASSSVVDSNKKDQSKQKPTLGTTDAEDDDDDDVDKSSTDLLRGALEDAKQTLLVTAAGVGSTSSSAVAPSAADVAPASS